MFLPRVFVTLVAKHFERVDEARSRRTGIDDVVDVAAGGGKVRMCELSPVLLDASFRGGLRILGRIEFLPEQYFHGAFGAHDCDLRGWPRQVHISPDVLRVHHVIGASIGLTNDDGDLRNRGLGESVEQFRAVADDPPVLLANTRQEPWDILEDDQRDVEGVAKTYEPRPLYRGVDIQDSCEDRGLIGNDPDRMTPEVSKANDEILSENLVNFVELPVIYYRPYDVMHVIGFIGVIRYNLQ